MFKGVMMIQTANIRVANITARSSDLRLPARSLDELRAQAVYDEAKRELRRLARGRSKLK